jgi:hypothetical protein
MMEAVYFSETLVSTYINDHFYVSEEDREHCPEDMATFSGQCTLLAAKHYTTQAAFQLWPPKRGSYLLIVLLMMGILVPETC